MPHKAEQLILHFGLAKTGSTAIQKSLSVSKAQLLERDATLYPGTDEQHFHFQSLFTEHPDRLTQVQRMQFPSIAAIQTFLANYRDGLLEEINLTKPRRIIISSEYFSGMNVGELQALHEFLKTIAEEIILFGYLRDPWSFSVSLIQEMIRNGQLTGNIEIGYAMSDVEILNKFVDGFGLVPAVAPYIPGNINVVADFFERFSLGAPPPSGNTDSKGINQGLERETASLMLYLNKVYPTFKGDGSYIADGSRDWMIESLMYSPLARTPLRISRHTANRIYEQARKNIEFIEQQYFGGVKAFTEYYNEMKYEDFDDTITWENVPSEAMIKYLISSMRYLSDRGIFYYHKSQENIAEIAKRDEHITKLEQEIAARKAELDAMRQSTSWKLKSPHADAGGVAAKTLTKIYIVGATGYLGKPLLACAEDQFPACGTSPSGLEHLLPLRLEEPERFDYECMQGGDVVMLTAAISSPDICSKDKDRAWKVNVIGTSSFIEKVIARGGRVIFFSSDTVYGEREDEFDENAICNPAGEYAAMKREVEQRFSGSPSFKVIRLSYVFSREDKFSRYLDGCTQRSAEADLFHPFFRAIVHRDDVVAGALALAARWDEIPEQVINFGGPQVLSRVEFAECLREVYFHSLRFRVTEPDADFFENRPRIIAMNSPVFTRLLGRPPRTLCEAARLEFLSPSNIVRDL